MATISLPVEQPDRLSGTPRAHGLDRWMFVIMGGAAILFAWTLAGGMILCARNLSARRAYTRMACP